MAESILREARAWAASHTSTWRDYEYYKQKLANCGIYNKEAELADALKL